MIYPDEHPPPHFHAIYGRPPRGVAVSVIDIDPLQEKEPGLGRRLRNDVLEWAAEHQAELLDNWNRIVVEGQGHIKISAPGE